MKKIIALILLASLMVFALASCSNISESYADKVNKAAEDDKAYSYDKVMKDLGDDVVDISIEILGSRSGVLIAVKGCDSIEDIQEKLDDGKTVKGIIVTVLNNKATGAAYREITEDDLKD